MTAHKLKDELEVAVQRYFDLMYECDVSKFDQTFRDSAQLHGFREGAMTMWPASEYKQILAGRESPASAGAKRDEEILMMDFASDTQAIVKVRVRINVAVYIDYLIFHRIGGDWRITSKAYHLIPD